MKIKFLFFYFLLISCGRDIDVDISPRNGEDRDISEELTMTFDREIDSNELNIAVTGTYSKIVNSDIQGNISIDITETTDDVVIINTTENESSVLTIKFYPFFSEYDSVYDVNFSGTVTSSGVVYDIEEKVSFTLLKRTIPVIFFLEGPTNGDVSNISCSKDSANFPNSLVQYENGYDFLVFAAAQETIDFLGGDDITFDNILPEETKNERILSKANSISLSGISDVTLDAFINDNFGELEKGFAPLLIGTLWSGIVSGNVDTSSHCSAFTTGSSSQNGIVFEAGGSATVNCGTSNYYVCVAF